ncbi:MAG: insulinase family protein [Deltaproteobacteria bacterium]|nr:MAG: insulinase family protein [Deltaproteobacteria bacterium]
MSLKSLSTVLCLLMMSATLHADSSRWSENVKEITLKNGMHVIMYPRGEAPIFSAYIRVKAGGMDEDTGKTGLAHFLEHMAFKGTMTIGTRDYKKEKPLLDEIEKRALELAHEESLEKPDVKKISFLKSEMERLHKEEAKYIVKEEVSKIMLDHGGWTIMQPPLKT